jgi:hypothetical protein
MSIVESWFGKLPPLKRHVSPQWAAVIGFVFGAIGIGLFFLSFIDFIFPFVLFGVLVVTLKGQAAVLIGAAFSSVYGFFRAQASNNARAAAVPCTFCGSTGKIKDGQVNCPDCQPKGAA